MRKSGTRSRRAPALAGLIVIASQRGGTIRESLAMAKVYKEAQKSHGGSGDLMGELVCVGAEPRARRVLRARRTCARAVSPKITEAVALVEGERHDPGAHRVSNVRDERSPSTWPSGTSPAASLGIGGERVTGNEESALNDVAAALGTERTPASLTSERASQLQASGSRPGRGGRVTAA